MRTVRGAAHLLLLDAVLAVVVTAGYAGFATAGPDDGLPAYTGPAWLGLAVATGVGLPLAFRRRWSVPALAVVLAASSAATLLDITRDPYLAVGVALYLVALAEPARRAVPALLVTLVVAGAAVVTGEAVLTPSGDRSEAFGTAALVWLVVTAAWGAGRAVRRRRTAAADRDRMLAEQALTDERLRIAREIHDIVSHSLSLIVVSASVADHVAESRPEQTREALRTIERTGREALTEMRRALGVLRAEPAVAPAPGLADLSELAARAERAGLRVRLRVRAAREVPAGTALTVYRIVQEALTNSVRHAGAGTRCRVSVRVEPDGTVRIEADDDGINGINGINGTGGHGLAGMRERVMMYGGGFRAGPRPEGGFAVSAVLPPDGRREEEGTA